MVGSVRVSSHRHGQRSQKASQGKQTITKQGGVHPHGPAPPRPPLRAATRRGAELGVIPLSLRLTLHTRAIRDTMVLSKKSNSFPASLKKKYTLSSSPTGFPAGWLSSMYAEPTNTGSNGTKTEEKPRKPF